MKLLQYAMVFVLIQGLAIGIAAGDSLPAYPHEFWGSVTIDGAPAPAGTVIAAMIGDTEYGSIETATAGKYGSSSRYEGGRLVVSGMENQAGMTIVFLVDGREAVQTATFTPEAVTCLDLSVGSAVTPTPTSGGGSSGSPSSSGPSSGGSAAPVATTTPSATQTASIHAETYSLAVSSTGEVQESATVRTADGAGVMTIPAGTIARDRSGNPLGAVSIATADFAALPPVTSGTTVAIALECGPDGATFDPPITLSFTLTREEWAEIGDPSALRVVWYDSGTGTWQEVPATVDTATRTVTAQVAHFSVYALAWPSAQEEATAPAGSKVVAEATGTPGPTQPAAEGVSWPLAGVGCLVVLVLAAAVLLFRRQKGA